MARQRLGFAWVVVALALGLTSCASPEELRREDEATCGGMVFTPAPTLLLVVSRRKAWLAGTGLRHRLRTGVGVIGAGPGSRIGLRGRF